MRELEHSNVLAQIPSTKFPDRRKRKRHKAKEGALVSLVARKKKYWKMVDVSLDGMSFRYIPSEDLNGLSKLDIATQDLEFALEGIPFKVTSDCEFADGSTAFPNLRRCGVKFGSLTPDQKSRLADFIRRYTVPQKPRYVDRFHVMVPELI